MISITNFISIKFINFQIKYHSYHENEIKKKRKHFHEVLSFSEISSL